MRKTKAEQSRRGSLKNRYGNKTHTLCVCGSSKKEHFNNALKCVFKSGREKNYSWDTSLG